MGAVPAPAVESEREEAECGRGGDVGSSRESDGPDPSMSSVEKTLSYAASSVFVD
jgi:hypothetical protein